MRQCRVRSEIVPNPVSLINGLGEETDRGVQIKGTVQPLKRNMATPR